MQRQTKSTSRHKLNFSSEDTELKESKEKNMNCASGPSTKIIVLAILCLQNSLYTLLRRYSQGYLHEVYSKYEVLLVAEAIKFVFSSFMVARSLEQNQKLIPHLKKLMAASSKMFFLAILYGVMNILSFIALRNIDAGTFTIFAQLKILTTACFSTVLLNRKYTGAKWRALIELVLGALMFSSHIFSKDISSGRKSENVYPLLGIAAVITEVATSGFASIYFEKVVKSSTEKLNIWERNFQLAYASAPMYLAFIIYSGGGTAGLGGGWTTTTVLVSCLGAAGGLLVALSIKYADAILKTLATTGAILLSSTLDHLLLDGPLTPIMLLAGGSVILAICNYTFDKTPEPSSEESFVAIKNRDCENVELIPIKSDA